MSPLSVLGGARSEVRDEIDAVWDEVRSQRAETSASIERLSDRQHADANAVNAQLDVLLLARGSLPGTPDAAPAPGEQQPATAAESAPEYRVPPRGAGESDRR